MGKVRKEMWTFCKSQLSAMSATAIDFLITMTLAEGLGLWYVYATFIGAFFGAAFNCAFNYRWVFFQEGLKKKKVVTRYYIVWVGSIMLNTVGTYLLTELSSQHFVISKLVISILVAILWNYRLQKVYVYKINQ